jgi:hypothetical protein
MMGKTRKGSRTEIYIKREKWTNGYHAVARTNGRFVSAQKWHGKQSSVQLSEKLWNKHIRKEESEYSFLVDTKTKDGASRSMSVKSSRIIFIGDKKHRTLDTVPIKSHAHSKYQEYEDEWDFSDMKMRRIYKFGVKWH